jgi:hypothetical protein
VSIADPIANTARLVNIAWQLLKIGLQVTSRGAVSLLPMRSYAS